MERALGMATALYGASARPQWDTSGARLPASHDPVAIDASEQCGVRTGAGLCRARRQGSLFCPTHARLASKYTRKYHACTAIVSHANTIASAKRVLQYVVALRTVVYLMHRDAAAHKGVEDPEAANHAMPINYFEGLLREDKPLSALLDAIARVPPARELNASIPASMEHFLVEPHVQADMVNDAENDDVVVADAAPAAAEAVPRAASVQRTPARIRSRRVIIDGQLRPYDNTTTEVAEPVVLWMELLRCIDDGESAQLVLSFPYVDRTSGGEMRLTGTVVTYLYDAASGAYLFGSDTFYKTGDVRIEDYQRLRLVMTSNSTTTARRLSVDDLLSATTQRIMTNSQNCFLVEVVARGPEDHRAVRAFFVEALLDISRRFRHAARALLHVDAIEDSVVSTRIAARFPVMSKRFLSHVAGVMNRVFDDDVVAAAQEVGRRQQRRAIGQASMTNPKTLAEEVMSKDVEIRTLRSTVRYLSDATPANVRVPEVLCLAPRWWTSRPVSTLHLGTKYAEQMQDTNRRLDEERDASTPGVMAMFMEQTYPLKIRLVELIQQITLTEIGKYKGSMPSRVLVQSQIDELNESTRQMALD